MQKDKKPFRFAIMGAGNIANKFCDAVKLLDDCEVAAIGSKSMERAEAFAKRHEIQNAFDSYENMLEVIKPDCVYVAVNADAHYDLTMLCLKHHTPVLCEKAMFMNGKQAEKAFALSEEIHIFTMEAMWSRFLPAVRKAKQWVEEGRIGAPVYADMSIGWLAPKDPANRYFNPKQGAGAAYDLMVYCYEILTYFINMPAEVLSANAVFTEDGVDVTDHVSLRFSGSDMRVAESDDENEVGIPVKNEVLASCNCTVISPMEEKMVLYGERGKIILPVPHYPSEAFLYDKNGVCTEHYRDEITQNGFTYEIEEVMRCVRAGEVESAVVPHRVTGECAKLFDKLMAFKEK